MEAHDLTTKMTAKLPKLLATAKVRLTLTRKKSGEPEGSPLDVKLGCELEHQLQTKLNVPSFIIGLASITVDAALFRLDEGRIIAKTKRTDVEVEASGVRVVVVENVVKLAAKLQAQPFGEFEGLVEVHVGIPVGRPEELVPVWVGLAASRVRAPDVEQACAGRHPL